MILQYPQGARHTEDVAAESAGQLELLTRARLRGLREARGWSLDTLAARTHLSAATISRIETGKHAAEFILLGSDTVQVCTGVMKYGYAMVRQMKDDLLSFMAKHNFETIEQFKGHSLQFFTTHADLVKRQAQAKAAARANVVKKDDNWKGDEFVKQTEALARG